MKTREKGPAGPEKGAPVPLAARFINTAIAVVLLGLSIYHYTQPNQAWRSGTAELACAVLLLLAAYVIPGIIAMAVDLAVAVVITGLGVRHLIHGGGWRSGTTELLFALLLVAAAIMLSKNRNK